MAARPEIGLSAVTWVLLDRSFPLGMWLPLRRAFYKPWYFAFPSRANLVFQYMKVCQSTYLPPNNVVRPKPARRPGTPRVARPSCQYQTPSTSSRVIKVTESFTASVCSQGP